MKVTNFKIKDRLLQKNKLLQPIHTHNQDIDNTYQHHFLNLQYKFDSFLQKFQQFMNFQASNKIQNLQKISSKPAFQPDCRDNFVIVDLPLIQNEKQKLTKLEKWIGQLSKQVLSASFNYYNTGKFTYEQSKVFASQSFLRNICLMADKYSISAEQLKFIDKKMKEDIFPYLKSKYPMTNQKGSNKSLQKAIKQINNIQVLSNDFFYYTDIEFKFRENGRYDDLIMRLLNQIMSKVNQKSLFAKENQQISNFKDFQNFMTSIFQKTYDEKWINQKFVKEKKVKESTLKVIHEELKDKKFNEQQSSSQANNFKNQIQNQIENEAAKQKYKLQVEEYTNFQIGRKISENTQLFSEDEIKSQFLTIKSPAVLRILSKWCEQLWEKFSNENYFIERTEGIRMQKGNQINIMYPWIKIKLKTAMKQEKQNIQKFMKEIQEMNYYQQYLLLKKQLKSISDCHIDKIEKVTGKFSWKVVNNLENFIIVYLNRLIHGLTKVSQECYKIVLGMPNWPYPPNLISFKIGDMMRCKLSSKQREVLRVFQQIQRINNENPQKLKIVRIKNRLQLGTNDVLINVRFNNLITCEIQLAVSSEKTQFIKCSYNFSHYVYELQRSPFGPISEFCSIWKNLQNRSKQFKKLIQKQIPQKLEQIISNSCCFKSNQPHKLIQNDKPFICCQCGKAYYQNNFIVSHVTCQKCIYWKCALCQIQQNRKAKKKQFFLSDQTLNTISQFQDSQKIPDYGICIFIKKKSIQPIIFKCVNYNQKQYLFKNNEVQERPEFMKELSSSKQIKKFIKQCVLFSIPQKIGRTYIELNQREAIQQFIIPSYLNQCFKKQKQTISVLQQNLSKIDFRKIKATKQNKKCIKYIEFSSTDIKYIQGCVSKDYINLDCLNLSINQIQDINQVVKFQKLQKLYMSTNKIKQIPFKICELTKLKQINFQNNKINELPQSITLLKSLVSLQISRNKLQYLPQKFYQLQNLKQFVANKNNFRQFPYPLTKHKTIEFITISDNNMIKIPELIQQLGNLRELRLYNNSLNELPKNMENMNKIQKVNLSYNKFEQFDKSIQLWKNLVELNLAGNQLKVLNIPQQIRYLQRFIKVYLNSNQIQQINDTFQNFRLIQIVSLSDNKIKFLSQQCFHLNQLRQIDLSNNCIQQIDSDCFSKCKKLVKMILTYNKIKYRQSQLENKKNQFDVNGQYGNFNAFSKSFIKLSCLEVVNIIQSNIKSIPYDIGNLKRLKEFILKQNVIQYIPDTIGNLEELKVLDLSNNKIQNLNQNIFKLINLNCLDVSDNLIEFLPNKFQIFKKLKKLNIDHNKLKQLPKSIQLLSNIDLILQNNPFQVFNLKYLKRQTPHIVDLMNRNFKQIQDIQFQDKNKIKICNLQNNLFSIVPRIFFTFSNLTKMNLSDNYYLKYVPKQIQKWKNLTQLNLQNSLIQELPQEIGCLTQLVILNLKCENLKSLPRSIKNLKLSIISLLGSKLDQIQNLSYISAKKVDFSYQNLSQISQNIRNLKDVQEIDFQSNSLVKLPESIGELTKLTSLCVNNQKLTILPETIGNLINLKTLSFSNNLIAFIPKSIGKLLNLQNLQLDGNKLKQLPITMINLKNLDSLIISNNQIYEIPSWMGKLQKLKVLSAKSNKIKQIPIQICTEVITILQLQDNLINKIPKQLIKMKNIYYEKLSLSGNPVQDIQCYEFLVQKGDFETINWAKQWKEKQSNKKA